MLQRDTLMDRFTIMHVPDNATAEAFRGAVPNVGLKYGAAYTPGLATTLVPNYDEAEVRVLGIGADTAERSAIFPAGSTTMVVEAGGFLAGSTTTVVEAGGFNLLLLLSTDSL